MINLNKKNNQSGLALVTTIVFSAMAMIVIMMAISLTILTSQSSHQLLAGQRALHVAEAGVENALLRLLRNPAYREEILILDRGTAIIEVTEVDSSLIITATGSSGPAVRTVEVETSDVNGIMQVESWQEVF